MNEKRDYLIQIETKILKTNQWYEVSFKIFLGNSKDKLQVRTMIQPFKGMIEDFEIQKIEKSINE